MAKKQKKSKSSARRSQTEATLSTRKNWKVGSKVRVLSQTTDKPVGKPVKVEKPGDEYRPGPKGHWHLVNGYWEHYTRIVAA